jgi:3-oxoacyl-[acyl-carrier-protein] synthase II
MKVVLGPSDVVTAYGWGIEALWAGVLSGKTAIRAANRFAERGFPTQVAAMVPDLLESDGESRSIAMLARLLAPLAPQLDPLTPVMVATTVGEIEYLERGILESRPDLCNAARPQVLLERVQHMLGLRGPGLVVSSACASSSAALTCAAGMIRRNEAENVLVVTADAVSEFVYSGFASLLSLDDRPASPFDAARRGLTLGEAAAFTVVSSDRSPFAARSHTAILGWGNTSDAFHMTAPDPAAGGLSRAIEKAFRMAHRDPADVALIAAHGTGTVFSDAMEMVAFAKALPRPVPLFSVKGAVGHTLGAAGLVQILVAARALHLGIAPPMVGLTAPDPAAADWVSAISVPLRQSLSATLALSTNSGFGGVNTALLLEGRPT